MDTTNSSKFCRICCNRRTDDLHFLLDAENKSIVKKLRACADVTIEHDDMLPKYICKNCLQKLNLAYNFKIQCEYMDQKLRETIATSLQSQINLPHKQEESPSFFDSDDESSFGAYSSELLTMDDDIIEEECVDEEGDGEDEQFMEDVVYIEPNVQCDQVANANQFVPSQQFEVANNDSESNAMDISQKVVEIEKFDSIGSGPSTKESDGDQDMFSVKSDNASSPKMKKQFKCDTCDATFHIHSEYNKHKKTHGKNRYQCLLCNKWFAKRYLLNAHQKTHSGAKNHECSLCQKRYTSQTNLDRHIRVFHRQERLHKCTTCQKTFSQLSSLRLHQSVHIASREFVCDICQNKFKTEVHLKLHKKRHLPKKFGQSPRKYSPPKRTTYKPPVKMCVCNECGKRFASVALLRSHMQSHSQEKKYECNYCKKRFSFQQTLRNHLFLHTGEKRFKCDICQPPVSFRQIGHLQGHKLAIHSGIKPHSCPTCGKAFALRGNLTVHMRTHTDTKSFECKICSKKFHDSGSLKRHNITHQRKNESNTVNTEQILQAPTIEIPTTKASIVEPTIFNNVFHVNPTDIIPPAEIIDDCSQLIFKMQ